MPNSYAVMSEDEMMYVEGGFAISKNVFKYTVTAVVIAGCVALGGGLSIAGLRTVLGSMALKRSLVAALIKGIGILGIKAGNTLATKFMSGLIGCIAGDFMGNVFTKYIDPLDGKRDNKIKIW